MKVPNNERSFTVDKRTLTAFDEGGMPSVRRRIATLGITFLLALLCWAIGGSIHGELSFVWMWTRGHDSLIHGLEWVFPYLAIGCVIVLVTGIVRISLKSPRRYEPGFIQKRGIRLALAYGIFEEVMYRWLVWFIAFVALDLVKPLEALTNTIHPLANLLSLGILDAHAGYGNGLISGAVLISSIRWTKGPEGCQRRALRLVIGWYMGILEFSFMMNFGMINTIIIHILLYVVWFTTWATIARLQRPKAEPVDNPIDPATTTS